MWKHTAAEIRKWPNSARNGRDSLSITKPGTRRQACACTCHPQLGLNWLNTTNYCIHVYILYTVYTWEKIRVDLTSSFFEHLNFPSYPKTQDSNPFSMSLGLSSWRWNRYHRRVNLPTTHNTPTLAFNMLSKAIQDILRYAIRYHFFVPRVWWSKPATPSRVHTSDFFYVHGVVGDTWCRFKVYLRCLHLVSFVVVVRGGMGSPVEDIYRMYIYYYILHIYVYHIYIYIEYAKYIDSRYYHNHGYYANLHPYCWDVPHPHR